jgi:hypothetical protein
VANNVCKLIPCTSHLLITEEWLTLRCTNKGVNGKYWDFLIVTEFSNSISFLRVYESQNGEWPIDLICHGKEVSADFTDGPKTSAGLLDLMNILSCIRKCSICQGIYEVGQCQACGRVLG